MVIIDTKITELMPKSNENAFCALRIVAHYIVYVSDHFLFRNTFQNDVVGPIAVPASKFCVRKPQTTILTKNLVTYFVAFYISIVIKIDVFVNSITTFSKMLFS